MELNQAEPSKHEAVKEVHNLSAIEAVYSSLLLISLPYKVRMTVEGQPQPAELNKWR